MDAGKSTLGFASGGRKKKKKKKENERMRKVSRIFAEERKFVRELFMDSAWLEDLCGGIKMFSVIYCNYALYRDSIDSRR